ncbi:hypothetical protein Bca52824_021900 [Brassica carinata]|uniref:RING-type domain-containing protein n=1 Tax=Brassica carinata TaxID=52824 RepID=A0A8X8ASL1_BRACI|nr:hypothetical protein Bca52824_021900 [Brassica carinata]
MEVNRSISLHCGSSSHQQSHVEGSIDTSSHSSQSPPSGDIDPDNMTYEELNELGESIGAVNKGLAKSRIDQIPTHKFGETSWFRKKVSSSSGETECSICLIEFKKGDTISTLPCAHIYHKDCISHWLEENKLCCVCKAEVGP